MFIWPRDTAAFLAMKQSTVPPNTPLITLEFTLNISQHTVIQQPTSAIPNHLWTTYWKNLPSNSNKLAEIEPTPLSGPQPTNTRVGLR